LQTDVLVAGGGLAGLACARALTDAGCRVTVVEAASRLGGRARSWRDERTGDIVDVGPHVVTTHHVNFLDLVRGCGTTHGIVWQRAPLLTLLDDERRTDIRLASLPAPFALVPTMLATPQPSLRAKLSNLGPARAALRLTETDVVSLDAISGEAYLRDHGVAPAFIDWFWRSMCMVLLNVPLERCSAGALMRCFAQLIGHRDYCFGFPAIGLASLFVPALPDAIRRGGGDVLLEAPLAQLRFDGDRCIGGRLRDGTAIDARHVVCALPPHETQALLDASAAGGAPDVAPIALARYEPSEYLSVMLWFERRVTTHRFWSRTWSPTRLNYDFYDLANIRPGFEGRGSLIASNIIHSQRLPPMSDDEVVAATLRELAEFAPVAAGLQPVHSRVHRIPLVVTCAGAGFEAKRPDARLAGVRNVLLAGDWTRTALPESMESAVRSGRIAAEAVLLEMGRPQRLALDPPATTGLAGVLRRARERRQAAGR